MSNQKTGIHLPNKTDETTIISMKIFITSQASENINTHINKYQLILFPYDCNQN